MSRSSPGPDCVGRVAIDANPACRSCLAAWLFLWLSLGMDGMSMDLNNTQKGNVIHAMGVCNGTSSASCYEGWVERAKAVRGRGQTIEATIEACSMEQPRGST